jgi:hypothetical protein
LTAWQRERCDRRGRDYVEFNGGDKSPKFDPQTRQGYIKPDTPYLARKPSRGCKPFIAGQAAPEGPAAGEDSKILSLSCALRF